ncbi:MAG: MBL fold metallo-hydrolase [Deltaproteobacteria bacterium]|nr:MBL fold metallo-hydrolase [Deltaproteobacteria bacterium]
MPDLTLVCCGTPTPTPERFGSCYVVRVNGSTLMFDCGPAATHKLLRAGLRPTDVSHLFFTHHHYDHNADYPCFLLCRWDHATKATPSLTICGPKPTRAFTDALVGPDGAFAMDWRARVEHPASQETYRKRGGELPRSPPENHVRDVEPGVVLETNDLRVTASRAAHVGPWLEALSYRIDHGGGSIVISGDSGPCEELRCLASGAGTLVLNLWDRQEDMSPNAAAGLLGTADAGRVAAEAGAKRLILAHQPPSMCRSGAEEAAIVEVSRHFDGEIFFGHESGRYEI